MEDAQTLFRDGVRALKQAGDVQRARELLRQSLRLDPNNEQAWLWLAQTTKNPEIQLQCVDRALSINPDQPQAQAARDKICARIEQINTKGGAAQAVAPAQPGESPEPTQPPAELARPTPSVKLLLTPKQEKQIKSLLMQAQVFMDQNQAEQAIERWVRVLEIQSDHPIAIQEAVRNLAKLGYMDDGKELLHRAIHDGTTAASIYLTALDIAWRQGDHVEADDLLERIVQMPNASEEMLENAADFFVKFGQPERAREALEAGLARIPDGQKLLFRLGKLYETDLNDQETAIRYYDRAARVKSGTKLGREADRALENVAPVLTDSERGSFALAFREALGVGVFFWLLGWQDAGLDMLQMGGERWGGVLLAILGGYLVVSATSSPQQQPRASWLGGSVPPPRPKPEPTPGQTVIEERFSIERSLEEPTAIPMIPMALRVGMGVIGGLVLVAAFILVFSASIDVLRNPVPPYVPSLDDLIGDLMGTF
ncbi:MAG: tetratricopeptide repeat protein [Chloroflexi bacterium]|nr:tetratricopeptide repeat protein [Chloroflexota bacterium]